MRRWLLLLCLPATIAGCIDADLGKVPLYCNPGLPRCPEGYSCVRFRDQDYCVKEGVDPEQALGRVDGGSAAER